MPKSIKKSISLFVVIAFMGTSMTMPVYAQAVDLPTPGTMVNVSAAFDPALIKGLTVHKDNPFLFDFIVDPGQSQYSQEVLKEQSDRMIKYFFAAMTVPDKDVWVNLSPYEKDRMVPTSLGQTNMGRDLLAQDYLLKQLTASLIYPQNSLGKSFWQTVYAKAQKEFGTTNIPVNTFNKVWIVPQRIGIYEHGQTAYIVDSHLKVMLEEDYLATTKHTAITDLATASRTNTNQLGSQIIRQIVLPEIEKEVNGGKNFATLRQIVYAQALAVWFKHNLKQALLNQVYANKGTVKGIDQNTAATNEAIYKQYLKAYKKGVFNYIKEDVDPITQETLPRKYFSGGYDGDKVAQAMVAVQLSPTAEGSLNAGATKDIDVATLLETNGGEAATLIRNVDAELKLGGIGLRGIKFSTSGPGITLATDAAMNSLKDLGKKSVSPRTTILALIGTLLVTGGVFVAIDNREYFLPKPKQNSHASIEAQRELLKKILVAGHAVRQKTHVPGTTNDYYKWGFGTNRWFTLGPKNEEIDMPEGFTPLPAEQMLTEDDMLRFPGVNEERDRDPNNTNKFILFLKKGTNWVQAPSETATNKPDHAMTTQVQVRKLLFASLAGAVSVAIGYFAIGHLNKKQMAVVNDQIKQAMGNINETKIPPSLQGTSFGNQINSINRRSLTINQSLENLQNLHRPILKSDLNTLDIQINNLLNSEAALGENIYKTFGYVDYLPQDQITAFTNSVHNIQAFSENRNREALNKLADKLGYIGLVFGALGATGDQLSGTNVDYNVLQLSPEVSITSETNLIPIIPLMDLIPNEQNTRDIEDSALHPHLLGIETVTVENKRTGEKIVYVGTEQPDEKSIDENRKTIWNARKTIWRKVLNGKSEEMPKDFNPYSSPDAAMNTVTEVLKKISHGDVLVFRDAINEALVNPVVHHVLAGNILPLFPNKEGISEASNELLQVMAHDLNLTTSDLYAELQRSVDEIPAVGVMVPKSLSTDVVVERIRKWMTQLPDAAMTEKQSLQMINARVAQQEKEGQQQLSKSELLPLDGTKGKESEWAAIGIKLGDPVEGDPLFRHATLPAGWKKVPTDHDMYIDLVDDKGKVRAQIFYKAAFHDRLAEVRLVDKAALANVTQDFTRGGIDLSEQDAAMRVTKDASGGVEVNVDPALIVRIEQEGIFEAIPVIINMKPANLHSLFQA